MSKTMLNTEEDTHVIVTKRFTSRIHGGLA